MTLPPPVPGDSKDWTWVLERPCPECGYDARALDRSGLGTAVRDSAASWGAVLGRPDARDRPDEATWSPLEYGCHVRDVLRLYDRRLHLMLEQDDPLYPDWDQDATAVESRYDTAQPAVVAVEVVEAGERLASAVDGVAGAQWERRGRRTDGADFSVDGFTRYLLHDLVHHRHDVRG